MNDELTELAGSYQQKIATAITQAEVDQLERVLFHPKSGRLTQSIHYLKQTTDLAQRKAQGLKLNQLKKTLQTALTNKRKELGRGEAKPTVDLTLPGLVPAVGHFHPLRLVQTELVNIFQSMNFAVYEGNELETEDYCFEFLNIPPTHPARDLQDTFYVEQTRSDGLNEVLRTHTSNMQVRLMRQYQPPLRIIVPGRVFRNEAIDAAHEHTFYQLEGFVVDTTVSIGQLVYVLRQIMSQVLRQSVQVRLRPGYFPYVEPGFEADCSCTQCGGQGCSVCKHTGWVEMLGCGMIHPKVFASAGYPAGRYSGFAFGLGINRLAMMRYRLPDIRDFMGGDLRFLEQF